MVLSVIFTSHLRDGPFTAPCGDLWALELTRLKSDTASPKPRFLGWEWGNMLVWNNEVSLPHFSIRNAYFFHLKLVTFWTDDDSNPASTQTGAQVPRAFWGVGDAKGGPGGPWPGACLSSISPTAGSLEEEECICACVCVCVHLFLICRFRVEENQLVGLTD